MADARDPAPRTEELCGTFTEPTVRDNGRQYSAAISPGCAAPDLSAEGSAEIVFIDGEPQALEIEA